MAILYRKLKTNPLQIRLMELLPADSIDAPVICRLMETTFHDVPKYEALSYTWGDPDNLSKEIEVDSATVKITDNLDSALRYLRHSTAEGARMLWVDALCINQQDIDERNHQVTAMKQIYENCAVDLAWLGLHFDRYYESKPNSVAEGLNLLRLICEHDVATLEIMANHDRLPEEELQYLRRWAVRFGGESKMLSQEEKSPLYHVLHVQFWERIWITQELAVAPRVVLVAGHSTLDWSSIEAFLKDQPYADAFHVSWSHGSIMSMTDVMFDSIKVMRDQRGLTQQAEVSGRHDTLLNVMARFRNSAATDPRDRVYALLGLVPAGHGIRVDYREEVHQVYINATCAMINSCVNLDMLCQNSWHSQSSYEHMPILPSWATNFSQQDYAQENEDLAGMIFAQRGIFSAGKPHCEVPCQVTDKQALRVIGSLIGRVGRPMSVASREYYWRWQSLVRLCRRWWQACFREHEGSHTYATTGEPYGQAFWRTLLFDCEAYPIKRLSDEALKRTGEVFERGLFSEANDTKVEQLSDDSQSESDSEEDEGQDRKDSPDGYELYKLRMFARNLRLWNFCLSDNGLYLMIRNDAKEGDILAVLDGAKVPVVLRPADDTGLLYSFVGTSYVHGYMDGLAEEEVKSGLLKKGELMII